MPGSSCSSALAALAGAAYYAVVVLGEEEEGPEATAEAFAEAWSSGDGEALRALVTDPATIDALDPVAMGTDFGATETAITLGRIDEDPDEAQAPFTATLTLGDIGEISWRGELPLVEDEDAGWRVAWSEPVLHPLLQPGGSITTDDDVARTGADPRPGDQADRRRRRAGQRRHRAEAVRPGGVDPDPRRAAPPRPGGDRGGPRPALGRARSLRADRRAHRRGVRGGPPRDLSDPRGRCSRVHTGRGGLTRDFARQLLGRYGEVTAERLEELGPPYAAGNFVGLDGLEARYEEQLAGRPNIVMRIVDAEGETVEELGKFPGVASAPVRTTLDPDIQRAAERAMADVARRPRWWPSMPPPARSGPRSPGRRRGVRPGDRRRLPARVDVQGRDRVRPPHQRRCSRRRRSSARPSSRSTAAGSRTSRAARRAPSRSHRPSPQSCNTAFIGAAERAPRDGAR